MNHIEVFFISPKDGWAVAEFDVEGNQVGDATFIYGKKSAVNYAIKFHKEMIIEVFLVNGSHSTTISPA